MSLDDWAHAYEHNSQRYGFSPVCERRWTVRFEQFLNTLPQNSHVSVRFSRFTFITAAAAAAAAAAAELPSGGGVPDGDWLRPPAGLFKFGDDDDCILLLLLLLLLQLDEALFGDL